MRHTYEDYMFKVGSKKLGVAQAVLNNSKDQAPSTEELEKMLRYGAYYMLHDKTDVDQGKVLKDTDVDKILQESTIVRYDDGNEEEALSKAVFKIDEDAINLNADDFWEQITPDVCKMLILLI